jgi:hypothetical protein
MNQLFQRLACYWILATVLHLPMPMIDGDEWCEFNFCLLTQGGAEADYSVLKVTRGLKLCGYDINYFFVGCPAPEDLDHGPVAPGSDTDLPMLGAFPIFLKAGDSHPVVVNCPLLDCTPCILTNTLAVSCTPLCQSGTNSAQLRTRPYAALSPVIRC